MITIGDRIKEIRKRYGLSQEKFSEELNTYRQRIIKIESGAIEPTFREIVDICEKFNTDIESFITSKKISTQDFRNISERYVSNNQLSFEERRETIEGIYISLADNYLKTLYKNVTNDNIIFKNG